MMKADRLTLLVVALALLPLRCSLGVRSCRRAASTDAKPPIVIGDTVRLPVPTAKADSDSTAVKKRRGGRKKKDKPRTPAKRIPESRDPFTDVIPPIK